jgi:hypothetical protein
MFKQDPFLVEDYNKRHLVCSQPEKNKGDVMWDDRELVNQYGKRIKITLIRDDFFCGGTKSRITSDYFDTIDNYSEYVYSTTPFGGAQIAIALECRARNKKFTVFTDAHGAYTQIAHEFGAHIVITPNPSASAQSYVDQNSARGVYMLPNGLRTYANIFAIAQVAAKVLNACKPAGGKFDDCFCAVGSGALINGLVRGNLAASYHGVCVFGACSSIPAEVEQLIPDMPFEQPYKVRYMPPFVSASRYDAKIWEYVVKFAQESKKDSHVVAWFVM